MRSVLAPAVTDVVTPDEAVTAAPGEASAPPPAGLVVVSGAVVAAAGALAVLGALRTGATWDEPYHVMRLQNFLDEGWFALDWSLGSTGPTDAGVNTAVYAPVTMLLLHALAVAFGVEEWGTVLSSPAAYDVRHLGIVVIGLGGTLAAAAITRRLLGSWRWGLVTAAVLLALPMWTGHLMFNPKDVSVATGYTVMTLALVAAALATDGRGGWLRIVGVAAGAVLMVGTRPAMWTAVAVGLALLAAGAVVLRGSVRTRAPVEAAAGAVFAAVALVALYPRLFAEPSLLLHSAEQSASFRGGSEANVGYLPFFVAAQTPLLLLAFFVVGAVGVISFARSHWAEHGGRVLAVALVVAQLAALPLAAVVRQSDLYNGLRQVLFAAPVWAVIATLGLARLLAWGRARSRARLAAGLAAVALVVPTVDQALLFPYGYTYYNAALDLGAAVTDSYVPSDYWRASVPELLPGIPTDGPVVCGPTRTGPEDEPERMTAGRYSSDSSVDCRVDPLGPLAPWWAERGLPLGDSLPADSFYAVIDRDHPLPANCARLDDVTRQRHLREIRMTYVSRCRLDAPPLGREPVAFALHPDELRMPPELWAFAPRGWVMRESAIGLTAAEPSASLGFTVPAACRVGDCVLELDATSSDGLTAEVGGTPVAVTRGPGTLLVPLPTGTTTARVTFADTGAPLDLEIRTLRVTTAPTDGEAP